MGSAPDVTELPTRSKRVVLLYSNGERKPWAIMPIGLSYVASDLERRGHCVRVVDLMFQKAWKTTIEEQVLAFNPDYVGISIRNIDNVDWGDTKEYLAQVRDQVVAVVREATRAPILIGGPAVNIMPRRVLEYVGADFAVYGDGEQTAARVIESGLRRGDRVDLPGVVVREQEQELHAPARVQPLDEVAFPRIHRWIDTRPYVRSGAPYPVQTKRGCQFACSYCVYGAIEGRSYRLRDPHSVAEEIAQVKRETGIWRFEFTDSVFNHPPGYAESICKAIIERRLDVSLNSTGVSPAFLSPELLDLMEGAGFEEYSLAPDSASPRVLAHLGKGYQDAKPLEKAAAMVRKSTLRVIWWFMLGLPGECAQSVQETISFIAAHVGRQDMALVTVGVRIHPGTRLAAVALQQGQVSEDQDWVRPVYYEPPEISLHAIHDQVMRAAMHVPTILTASQTRQFESLIGLGAWVKRVTRHRQPLWAAIPAMSRLRNAVIRTVTPPGTG